MRPPLQFILQQRPHLSHPIPTNPATALPLIQSASWFIEENLIPPEELNAITTHRRVALQKLTQKAELWMRRAVKTAEKDEFSFVLSPDAQLVREGRRRMVDFTGLVHEMARIPVPTTDTYLDTGLDFGARLIRDEDAVRELWRFVTPTLSRWTSLLTLQHLKKAPLDLLDKVTSLLSNPPKQEEIQTVYVLLEILAKRDPANPLFAKLSSSTSPSDPRATFWILNAMEKTAPHAIPTVIEKLRQAGLDHPRFTRFSSTAGTNISASDALILIQRAWNKDAEQGWTVAKQWSQHATDDTFDWVAKQLFWAGRTQDLMEWIQITQHSDPTEGWNLCVIASHTPPTPTSVATPQLQQLVLDSIATLQIPLLPQSYTEMIRHYRNNPTRLAEIYAQAYTETPGFAGLSGTALSMLISSMLASYPDKDTLEEIVLDQHARWWREGVRRGWIPTLPALHSLLGDVLAYLGSMDQEIQTQATAISTTVLAVGATPARPLKAYESFVFAMDSFFPPKVEDPLPFVLRKFATVFESLESVESMRHPMPPSHWQTLAGIVDLLGEIERWIEKCPTTGDLAQLRSAAWRRDAVLRVLIPAAIDVLGTRGMSMHSTELQHRQEVLIKCLDFLGDADFLDWDMRPFYHDDADAWRRVCLVKGRSTLGFEKKHWRDPWTESDGGWEVEESFSQRVWEAWFRACVHARGFDELLEAVSAWSGIEGLRVPVFDYASLIPPRHAPAYTPTLLHKVLLISKQSVEQARSEKNKKVRGVFANPFALAWYLIGETLVHTRQVPIRAHPHHKDKQRVREDNRLHLIPRLSHRSPHSKWSDDVVTWRDACQVAVQEELPLGLYQDHWFAKARKLMRIIEHSLQHEGVETVRGLYHAQEKDNLREECNLRVDTTHFLATKPTQSEYSQ